MTLFRGTYTVRMDDKGRLKLPAPVKDRLDKEYGPGSVYFITSLTGDIVLVYPLTEWQRFEDSLAQRSQFEPLKRKVIFTANRFGAEVTMDDQGRLLVPGKLRDKAGMKGEVTLFWQSDHLEVYNQEFYEAEAEKNTLTPEELAMLEPPGH